MSDNTPASPLRIAITGANSGIGLVMARTLAQQGAEVLMICRSQERGEAARQQILETAPNAQVQLHLCDLAVQSDIRHCGQELTNRYDRLDVLINNAGAMFGQREITDDGLEQTLALNHVGPFLLTHHLLPLLRQGTSKRIVNVNSEAHRFVRQIDWDNWQGRKDYGEFKAYALAKLANVYFTRALAERLRPEGITVNAVHPGFVDTGFGKEGSWWVRLLMPIMKLVAISPEKGAETPLHLATSEDVSGVTGEYFVRKRSVSPSPLAQREDHQARLWRLSQHWAELDTYDAMASNPS
jgi:NAD(P)-dependent dehydrogenase (short-subunit alcohol dehydrogenase family)